MRYENIIEKALKSIIEKTADLLDQYCFEQLKRDYPEFIPNLKIQNASRYIGLNNPLRPYPFPSGNDGFGDLRNIMLFIYRRYCFYWGHALLMLKEGMDMVPNPLNMPLKRPPIVGPQAKYHPTMKLSKEYQD
jgi:hypothetical protein